MIRVEDAGVGTPFLIGGDQNLGFFGEVLADDLIWGRSLTALVGLEVGFPLFDNEPWLKFIDHGVIKFVAKKPIKYYISWDDLHDINVVYGGLTATIGDYVYRVRLFQGSYDEPTHWNPEIDSFYYDGPNTHGGEWNRLMYPVHQFTPPSQHIPNWVAPTSESLGLSEDKLRLLYTRKIITKGEEAQLLPYMTQEEIYKYQASQWQPYTNAELNVADNFGRNNWCQETWAYNSEFRLQRGCDGISYTTIRKHWERNDSYGWRPILELIGKKDS